MPMPDWFDPSMLFGGQGGMPGAPYLPPGLLNATPAMNPAMPQMPGPNLGAAPPPGIGMPARQNMPPPMPPAGAMPQMNPMMLQQLQAMQGAGGGQMAGQAMPMNAMQQGLQNALGAGQINPNLMQMLRMGLGAQRPPMSPMNAGMGIY